MTPAMVVASATASTDAARIALQTTGMQVLLAWAVLNICSGIVGRFARRGVSRYVFEMNAVWNVVNAAIAVTALIGLSHEMPASSLALALDHALSFERVVLVNVGLDVAYGATGAFLLERGLRRNSERLRGYGRSLFLQGGFLFVFDSVLFALTHQQTSRLLLGLNA